MTRSHALTFIAGALAALTLVAALSPRHSAAAAPPGCTDWEVAETPLVGSPEKPLKVSGWEPFAAVGAGFVIARRCAR